MKYIDIKEGGALWRLVTLWGTSWNTPRDFCSLFWQALRHLFLIGVAVGLGGALLGVMVGEIVGFFMTGFQGTPIFTLSLLFIITCCVVVVILLASGFYVHEKCSSTENKTFQNIKTVYSGWKEKFCPVVRIVDK